MLAAHTNDAEELNVLTIVAYDEDYYGTLSYWFTLVYGVAFGKRCDTIYDALIAMMYQTYTRI